MSEFDREERAFRAALLEHAEQVPTDSIRFELPRRRTSWLPVAAAAAVVVLIVGLVVALRPDGASAPPQPAGPTPSATTAPTEAEESNAAPAEDPAEVLADGTVEDVAVTPGDRDSRAVLWRKNRRTVVAVTHDGFATGELHEFRGWWTLEPAGAGRFLVVSGDQKAKIRMLESDRGPIEIAVSGDEYPAQAGEVLVRSGVGQESGVIAVNPASREAHRVPVPSDVPSWSVFGGRITGVAYGAGSRSSQYPYHWSDDGGRTWQSATLSAEGASALWHVAASPKGGPHRVVEGGDGATLFPLIAVHELTTGNTFARTPYDNGGVFTAVSTPFVWGDETRMFVNIGDRGTDEAGLHRYGTAGVERIQTNAPDAVEAPMVGLTAEQWIDGQLEVWLWDYERRVLLHSVDGGEIWGEFAAR